MGKYDDCDFSGWVTKNDVLCKDGRRIMRDAFKHQDGMKVPLVWGHQHDSPEAVLGHIFLENHPEGVRGYGYLNDSPMGQYSRIAIDHGDVDALSIWANELKQSGGDVLHGSIKEVSLVLAGANEKAHIDYLYVAHGDDIEENMTEAEICYGEHCCLEHSAMKPKKDESEKDKPEETNAAGEAEKKEAEPTKEEKEPEMAEETKEKKPEEAPEKEPEKESTVGEVLDTLNEDQKKAVSVLIAAAMAKKKAPEAEEKEKETDEVKHSEDMEDATMQYNAFNAPEETNGNYVLSHAEELDIIADAKKRGSFRDALNGFADEKSLAHDALAPVSGFPSYPNGATPANIDMLFPEFKDVRPGAPELITDDLAWVEAILNKVQKVPYNRIRTRHTDIRKIDEIRAKGYQKGREKLLVGNYNVAKRTTEPQTVYVYSELNRDDVQDITDFSYVDYQYQIDRIMLRSDLARAILIGDGRDAGDAQKIFEDKIRPIWGDNAIYTIDKVVKADAASNDPGFGEGYRYLMAVKKAIKEAKVDYRGSGNMTMFYEQEFFNKMSLATDLNGREMYDTDDKLLRALGVNDGLPVSEFQGKTRTVGGKTYKLLAIIGNMSDYAMGAVKGGEITHFTDFELKFNQYESLLETRCCGAIHRIGAFIVLEEEVNPQ